MSSFLRNHLEDLLTEAVNAAATHWPEDKEQPRSGVHIERTRDAQFGDFASNVAMTMAKQWKGPPRKIAETIIDGLPTSEWVERTEIAGPGFINFFITQDAREQAIKEILSLGEKFGHSEPATREKILLEFLSTNPTGPLLVSHGRHAAYGASLGNLLEMAGHEVYREYYINDAGRQIDILAASVWLRYLEKSGTSPPYPSKAYQGSYIFDIAAKLRALHNEKFACDEKRLASEQSDDTPDTDDDAYVDAVICAAKVILGEDGFLAIANLALDEILNDIKQDLEEFGVVFDRWFSERELADGNRVEKALVELKRKNYIYEKDGAKWFRSTDFDDDKDRVVVRDNGATTYITSDFAYHADKLERGNNRLIDVLGADHHGYVARVRAGLAAMDYDPDCLEVHWIQMVNLYRGKEKAKMSTRAGQYVTLRELRDEVGNDAARFFYVLRSNDQTLDFDLELAKSQSNDNPVYYIQYAHARVCSVFRELEERGWTWDQSSALASLPKLTEATEAQLIMNLHQFPESIEIAARNRAPHMLAHYLIELAGSFHTYYNSCRTLVDDDDLRAARLCLMAASRQVLANGLGLLGVNAPTKM